VTPCSARRRAECRRAAGVGLTRRWDRCAPKQPEMPCLSEARLGRGAARGSRTALTSRTAPSPPRASASSVASALTPVPCSRSTQTVLARSYRQTNRGTRLAPSFLRAAATVVVLSTSGQSGWLQAGTLGAQKLGVQDRRCLGARIYGAFSVTSGIFAHSCPFPAQVPIARLNATGASGAIGRRRLEGRLFRR
jgi:hypothetical protein